MTGPLRPSELPADEFRALAGDLKEYGSRFASWTVDENAALFKIVKKVEDDRASAPVGDKHTSTFWEAVAAAVEVQMPGRGARAQGHYRDYRAELAKNLPAG